jgi:Mg2+ and Co2+ transporter CorA
MNIAIDHVYTKADICPHASAVILVDPAFAVTCGTSSSSTSNGSTMPTDQPRKTVTPDGIKLDEVAIKSLEECLILQVEKPYDNRAELWKAQDWGAPEKLKLLETKHLSWPYHDGCSTLAPLMFSQVGIGAKEENMQTFRTKRNLTSAMDEMVFCWAKLASPDLIQETNEKSSNAAYYLLKHIAQHWVNQLEIMNTTIAKAEWFADDYQAQIDDNLSRQKWKTDLLKINEIAKDINYMRRHLNHFWRAMFLNLERLGVQLGSECVDEGASHALRGAQKDFLTIHTRMQPLRDRAEALNSVSNDLANLRAAFRGVADGEFSLRLSLFASVVFPLTLLAGIFSMGDDFRPGKPQFYKLWAIGVPFCVTVALCLVYGKRPWTVFIDVGLYTKAWLKGYKPAKPASGVAMGTRKTDMKRSRAQNEQALRMKRTGYTRQDEEHGLAG